MSQRRYPKIYVLILFSALWIGCDTVPGVEDGLRSAPVVSPGASFVNPEVIDTDRLQFVNGTATTEISVSIDVFDADQDAKKAFVVVQSPSVGGATAGEASVDVADNGSQTIRIPIVLSEGTSGLYQVVVFASDATERISNRLFGSLQITAGSEPPVIDQIDIPAIVTRPAQGQPSVQVPIVAHVSDPDGLGNIAAVEVIVNGAVTLRLCDDGGQGTCNSGFGSSGDVAAGDGLFTLTIQLDATNQPGENVFEFTAIDRSGLRSAQIARIIQVN